jgi:hypothetical protein
VADAEAKLVEARAQRTTVEEDYMSAQGEVRDVTTANVGLQSQLQALWAGGKGSLRWAHLVVAALFVLIELLPVLVKTLRCWGPVTPYDSLREGEEARRARRYPNEADAQDQIDDDEIAMRVEIARDRHRREKEVALSANERFAAATERAVSGQLDRWSGTPKGTA